MKSLVALIAVCALAAISVSAQNSRTTSKMLYHNGPVSAGNQNVYAVFYGCWNNNCGSAGDSKTVDVMLDFLTSIGNSPYMQINSTYPDSIGNAPNGAIIFGGAVFDSSYSHGVDLTDADMQGILTDLIMNFQLPQDPQGIYLIIASADVASNSTGFCATGAPPHHSTGILLGIPQKYIFLGNPNRCPATAGPQFFANGTLQPTPHNNFPADVLANNLAHALDAVLTNPFGNGWFDRYGLENADKCANTFGQTYLTANGARANLRLPPGDFLIQQNWVNDRKARCAMFQ